MSHIRVGIGGWTFEPWRDNFYPAGWPHARELEYASQRLRTLEVNGTFYSTMKPATFAKWRDETPPRFVFALKANRYTTVRRVLGEAGESVQRFLGSGLVELGDKLGPILWQMAPTKRFDPEDFEAFLKLLPPQVGGLPLRHAIEVRHESFQTPAYLALARRYGVATVFSDAADRPAFADLTGDFVYVRTFRSLPDLPLGFTPEALAQVADCARVWAAGGEPDGLPRIEQARPGVPRDVFLYVISGAKERNPAAAMALAAQL